MFLGGGTPTFTEPAELARLLAALPAADEVTVEANPETVTPELAALLRARRRDAGLARRAELPAGAARRARAPRRAGRPSGRAFYHLRDAGFDNISLDLVYGIPGQSPADLERDLAEAIALGPEHLSCYELEAKPGTRFTVAHGTSWRAQAEAMEGYFELVVRDARRRRLPLVRDGELLPARAGRRGTTSATGSASDYLGVGIGAVSTVGGLRWRNRPSLAGYLAALGEGRRPPRDEEPLEPEVVLRERLLLGLRLDEPVDAGQRGRRRRPGRRSRAWSGSGSPSAGTAAWRSRGAAGSSAAASRPSCMAESPAKSTL